MSLVYIIHVSILQILHIKHNTQMYIFNQILISYPLLTDWVHVSTFYNYQYLKVEEGSIFFSHVILHFTTCPISTNILFLFYFIHYFSINQHVAHVFGIHHVKSLFIQYWCIIHMYSYPLLLRPLPTMEQWPYLLSGQITDALIL